MPERERRAGTNFMEEGGGGGGACSNSPFPCSVVKQIFFAYVNFYYKLLSDSHASY